MYMTAYIHVCVFYLYNHDRWLSLRYYVNKSNLTKVTLKYLYSRAHLLHVHEVYSIMPSNIF